MTDQGGRDAKGLFKPGHGVKGGRRPGPTEGELIRAYLSPKKEQVLAKLVELAAEGDGRSLELFLGYLSPRARPDTEIVTVPGIETAEGIPAKIELVLKAAMSGEISAEQARTLLALLETSARILNPESARIGLEDLVAMSNVRDVEETIVDVEPEEIVAEESPVAEGEARPMTFVDAMRAKAA